MSPIQQTRSDDNCRYKPDERNVATGQLVADLLLKRE